MGGDQVEVAVVVEDVRPRLVGTCGDHEIRRRQAMVADLGQLPLRLQRQAFDLGVDRTETIKIV